MNTLIVVVDMGRFKAYRVSKDPLGSRKLELIVSRDIPEAHERISDRVTDALGRFGRGEAAGGVSKGTSDPNSLEAELERRIIRDIAQEINALVQKEGNRRWSFAAPEAIFGQIADLLSPESKSLLAASLKANLTKATKEDLLERF